MLSLRDFPEVDLGEMPMPPIRADDSPPPIPSPPPPPPSNPGPLGRPAPRKNKKR